MALTFLAASRFHFVVAALALLVAVFWRDPVLTLAVLPLASAAFVCALSRVLSPGWWLAGLALANLAVGLSVSLALYWLSSVPLPSLDGLVLGKGFWTFGGDGIYYHQRGLQIAYALSHEVLLPYLHPTYGASFIGMVGVLYSLLGPHPLLMPFVNCLFGAVSLVLVSIVVARVAGAAAGRRAALLAAVVPSMFLWSGQLLKDTPSLFLFLLALAAALRLQDAPWRDQHWRTGLLLLLVFGATFTLYTLRFYMASMLLIVLVVAVVLLAVTRRRRPRVLDGLAIGVVLLAIVVARAAGAHFLLVLVNPVHSTAAGTYLQAVDLEREGRLLESRDRYALAIREQPGFWPAYRRVGEVLICLGDFGAAEHALRRYLDLYPMDYSEPAIRRTIERLAQLRTALVRSSPTVSAASVAKVNRRVCGGLFVPLVPSDPSDPAPVRAAGTLPGTQAPGVGQFPPADVDAPAPVELDQRAELIWTLHSPERMYGDNGEFMLEPLKRPPGAAELMENLARAFYHVSPAFAANVRNGFVRTGGDSLYTSDLANNSVLQWLKWAPTAFLTTLGAPFPWTWQRGGRLDPLRVAMGLESIVVLVLLPFGLRGAWRALRSGTVGGMTVVVLFFFLATVLGLVIVNVGTLVRLRLPAMFLLVMLVGMGASRPKPE
jgi:hypothetical protein